MSDGQREALQALSRSQTAPHRQVQRAKALLLAADGVANMRIAAQVGVKPATVRAWRARFAEEGLAKLGKVRAGRGRKSTIPQEKIDEIVHLTRHSTPDGQTHWSCRTIQLHFTPTSSSWLNLVERWFRELTDKALRRGVFHSVPDLIAKIEDYLAAHNKDPKPFVWTATAQDILAKVARGRVALQAVNQ